MRLCVGALATHTCATTLPAHLVASAISFPLSTCASAQENVPPSIGQSKWIVCLCLFFSRCFSIFQSPYFSHARGVSSNHTFQRRTSNRRVLLLPICFVPPIQVAIALVRVPVCVDVLTTSCELEAVFYWSVAIFPSLCTLGILIHIWILYDLSSIDRGIFSHFTCCFYVHYISISEIVASAVVRSYVRYFCNVHLNRNRSSNQ